ncbi:hypothetical protein Tco_0852949 [Tanacetum coccineum]
MTRVNMFVDMDTKLVKESSKKAEAEMAQESSSKRVGDELEQEVAKKQKMDDDKEKPELQKLLKVISHEEGVAIDAIPLATKPPSIVDYKIIKEGKINIYQIIRADGSSKRYSAVIHMLRSFDKEDLETLRSSVERGLVIRVPRYDVAELNVTKASHWLGHLKKGHADMKESTPINEICTKTSAKEAQSYLDDKLTMEELIGLLLAYPCDKLEL